MVLCQQHGSGGHWQVIAFCLAVRVRCVLTRPSKGVLIMSFMAQENSLLARTNTDYGSLTYFVGTFGLHYLPVVATLGSLDIGGSRYQKTVLAAAPGVTFSAYCVVNRAEEVYGVPLPMTTALVLGSVYAGLAAATAWFLN